VEPVGQHYDRFRGQTATVVGCGPTTFEYAAGFQGLLDGPVLFVNDAVQLERHVPPDVPTFFFAFDRRQRVWLRPALRSTPVLARRPDLLERRLRPPWPHLFVEDGDAAAVEDRLVWYDILRLTDDALKARREEVAKRNMLVVGGLSTTCTALAYAWLAGVRAVRFIGCRGVGQGHDGRLCDATGGKTLPGHYAKARRALDQMVHAFRLEAWHWTEEPR